ncbi:N-acetyltransferase [Streptomyces armeniacus]|uniref:N-acetyltransferase n=1 Tax=Streptomyces armeniacus TaxID=83291 RepID=A0A345XYX3_9ACTN|nr:GNAT family N-acetyltransferase [Streptomyces armeniacus]AXK36839.1 N-acetyltransferase [Streptomyces armeniacus]
MDSDAVRAMFDAQMRRGVREGPGVRVEHDPYGVVRQIGTDGGWSGVIWSGLDADTADAAIAAQVRYFTEAARTGAAPSEFEWKVYSHDAPADLGQRLLAAGFTPEPEETLLVAPVRELPSAVGLPDGVRLRPVTDEAGVELMAAVHDRAFGAGRLRLRTELLAQLAAAPDTLAAVVAMAGDVPVCAARMDLLPGTEFAGLWGGGTVPEWRGRGIYKALIAYRARIAAERGYRYLQVDASSQSSPILRRLGFVALSTTTPYVYVVPAPDARTPEARAPEGGGGGRA